MASALFGLLVGSAATYAYTRFIASDSQGNEGDATNNNTNLRQALNTPLSAMGAATATQSQAGFISDLLAQLWPYVTAGACTMIKTTVEPTFKDMLPSPLSTLRFIQLDLGVVPLRLDNLVVHQVNRNMNELQLDMDVVWDGNCDIQLQADYIGRFGVKSVKISGRMSVLLQPLVPTLSVVQAVQVAFVNPPHIALDFVGLANVADSPLIRNKIQSVIQDIVQSMIVLPNRFLTKLDSTGSFYSMITPPLGILRLTVVQGSGFVTEERKLRKDDIPDVFVEVTLGNVTRKTSTQHNSLEPNWTNSAGSTGAGYIMDFLVFEHDQYVQLEAHDEDKGTLDSHDFLGSTKVTVGELLLQGGAKAARSLPLVNKEHKPTGAQISVCAELVPFTTKDLGSLAYSDEPSEENDARIHGMLTILIAQAKNLPIAEDDLTAKVFVKVTCAMESEKEKTKEEQKQLFVTKNVVSPLAPNPAFDGVFYLPLTAPYLLPDGNPDATNQKKIKDITLHLMNGPDCLATRTVTHPMLTQSPNHIWTESFLIPQGPKNNENTSSSGTEAGPPQLEYRMILQGMSSSLSNAASAGTTTPKDTTRAQPTSVPNLSEETEAASTSASVPKVRLTVVKGHGFKSEKRGRLVKRKTDIPDIYCHITFGSSPTIWRTATIQNSTEPNWSDESQEYPLQNHGQIVQVQVYDEDSGRRDTDDFLGSARITVGQLLLAAGGRMDVELDSEGRPTGSYITLACALVE